MKRAIEAVSVAALSLGYLGSALPAGSGTYSPSRGLSAIARELCADSHCQRPKHAKGALLGIFANKVIQGSDVQYSGSGLNSATGRIEKSGFNLDIVVGKSNATPEYAVSFLDNSEGITATLSYLKVGESSATRFVTEDVFEGNQGIVGTAYDVTTVSPPKGKEKGTMSQSPLTGIHSQNSQVLANTVLYMSISYADRLVGDIGEHHRLPSLGQFTVWAKEAQHLTEAKGL